MAGDRLPSFLFALTQAQPGEHCSRHDHQYPHDRRWISHLPKPSQLATCDGRTSTLELSLKALQVGFHLDRILVAYPFVFRESFINDSFELAWEICPELRGRERGCG